jgi:hypothetical protein
VDRHTVSGEGTCSDCARENHSLNWWRGDGASWARSRLSSVNCGAWASVDEPEGATGWC